MSYTALELARAAGFTIRRVPTGGMHADRSVMLLDVGPDATDAELRELAGEYIELPDELEPAHALVRAGNVSHVGVRLGFVI